MVSQDVSHAFLFFFAANIEEIDEYYYSVRIMPGQDPANFWVGWVTPSFHMYDCVFDMKKIRNVVVSTLDHDYKINSKYGKLYSFLLKFFYIFLICS